MRVADVVTLPGCWLLVATSEATLVPAEQAAWEALFDGTGGATQWTHCGTNRLDPCGCRYVDSRKNTCGVTCSADVQHILKL